MKKILLFQILAIVALATTTSCEDFLDLKPTDKIDMSVAYGTPERLESATLAYYNYLSRLLGEWHTGLNLLTTTDLVEAGPANDETDGYAFYRHTTDTWAPTQVWEESYIALGNLNEVLKYAGELSWSGEDTRRRRVYGSSYFFRAYMHFLLVQRYGNIILKTSPNEGVVIDTDATPVEDVYASINADLTNAIEMLEPLGNSEISTINVSAARMLKAKVALVQEDWTEALNQSEKIIGYGHWRLQAWPDRCFKPYEYDQHSEKEEILMVSYYDEDLNYVRHNIGGMCTPQYENISGLDASFEYGKHGRSLLYPTDYLLSLYESTDRRYTGLFRHEYWYNSGSQSGQKVNPADYSESVQEMSLHISSTKYNDEGVENPNLNSWEQFESFPLLRYAEVLLIASEASMHLGDQGKAKSYLKEVRDRANASEITEDITIDIIIEERARELCFEYGRWEDLKRTGKLLDHMRKYNPQASANVMEKHLLFPIPYRHISYSNFQYPQNQGW